MVNIGHQGVTEIQATIDGIRIWLAVKGTVVRVVRQNRHPLFGQRWPP